MTPIILALTCMKKTVLIPLINIQYMEEVKKGKTRIVLDTEECMFEVDESIEQIAASLTGMDILRRPANSPL
jgi:hypothetical protein